MGSFAKSLRVVVRILKSHIFVITFIVSQADGAQGPPVVTSVLEDRNARGDNGSSTDSCDAPIQTWIDRSDRGDTQDTGEALGEGQLLGRPD